MARVVSLGSVNIDRIRPVDRAELATLESRAEWLPAPGETRVVPDLPSKAVEAATETALGGKGANQAVAAAMAGAETTLLGAVGEDHTAVNLLPRLSESGVDVSHVARSEVPTGTALIVVDTGGENRIALREGANATVEPDYVRAHAMALEEADCLLLQNEIPVNASLAALEVIRDARDPPTVVLDPAPAPGSGPLVSAEPVDIITPNAEEASHLADLLAGIEARVITTNGSDPVRVSGSSIRSVTPPRVDPVDTTAAGDVFAGYLAAGIATAGTWEVGLERAVAAASLSTETVGAQASIPDRDAVSEFLAESGPLAIDHG